MHISLPESLPNATTSTLVALFPQSNDCFVNPYLPNSKFDFPGTPCDQVYQSRRSNSKDVWDCQRDLDAQPTINFHVIRGNLDLRISFPTRVLPCPRRFDITIQELPQCSVILRLSSAIVRRSSARVVPRKSIPEPVHGTAAVISGTTARTVLPGSILPRQTLLSPISILLTRIRATPCSTIPVIPVHEERCGVQSWPTAG